jgi:hypothetical protein
MNLPAPTRDLQYCGIVSGSNCQRSDNPSGMLLNRNCADHEPLSHTAEWTEGMLLNRTCTDHELCHILLNGLKACY